MLACLSLIANPNTIAAQNNEIPDSKGFSNDEILNMSEEELEKLGLTELLKSGFTSENVTLATYSPSAGDILVTKNTAYSGITGHAGIVLSNWQVLHIQAPGHKPTVISRDTWFSKYPSTKVVRSNTSLDGYHAANWAWDFYVAGAGRNYDYSINTNINAFDSKTYCSKIVWQAYYNGAKKSLATYSINFVLPYDFLNYTLWNGHKVVHTVNW